MKRIIITALTTTILLGSGYFAFAKDDILAKYKDGEVTKSEINTKLSQASKMSGAQIPSDFDKLEDQLKENIVKNYIAAKLIEKESQKSGIANTETFKKELEEVKKNFLQAKFIESITNNKITEKELKEEYKRIVKEISQQDEVKVKHILVDTEEEAKKILADIKSKKSSFEDLAREKSKDASNKDNGGELDYFGRGQMIKPFEDAAFAMKKDEISHPVQTDFGWHIIKMIDKRKIQAPSYEVLKDRIKKELSQKVVQEYLEALLKDAKIEFLFNTKKDKK